MECVESSYASFLKQSFGKNVSAILLLFFLFRQRAFWISSKNGTFAETGADLRPLSRFWRKLFGRVSVATQRNAAMEEKSERQRRRVQGLRV